MKHINTALISYLLAAIFALYYGIIAVESLTIISFSLIWLFLAGILGTAGLLIERKSKTTHDPHRLGKRTKIVLLTSSLITACILLTALFFIMTPAVSSGSQATQYVIILGGGLRSNGTLSEIPRNRIKKAALYLKAHPDSKAIVTGGKSRYIPVAEAPVLAQTLIKEGIAESRIIQEDQALDTIQNFYYSASCIAADSNTPLNKILEQPVTVVTSSFHLARAELIARRTGFKTVYGIESSQPLIFVPNSYCREIAAWIKLTLRIILTGKPEPAVKSFKIALSDSAPLHNNYHQVP